MTYLKIKKLRRRYSYRRRGVYSRIKVPAHRVTYHLKPKTYPSFKFVSPFQQFREYGEYDPTYVGYSRQKKSRRDISKDMLKRLERPPVMDESKLFNAPSDNKSKKIPVQSQIIMDITKKAEGLTEEIIAQRHKREAADKKKEEQAREEIFRDFSLDPEVKNIAIKKLDVLYKQDPGGRNLNIKNLEKKAIDLAKLEISGKQKVIPGVKTYEDSDYITELTRAGYTRKDAENIFFSLDPNEVIKRTPQQLIPFAEKVSNLDLEMEEGELVDKSKIKSMTTDETSDILDKLFQFRPDLKQHNRMSLINKLRRDVRETGVSDTERLRDFFNMDKPLKEVLKDEQTIID